MSIPPSRLGIATPPGTRKHRRLEGMPVTVTVGAAGTATFTWPGVPQDEIWTGAVSVPLALPSSVLPILWSAFDGGTPIGQWYNSQSSGPLQVNTQLKVTGSGIAAATLVATLQGIATDLVSAPPWWPAPTPAPPPASPQLIVNVAGLSVPSGGSVAISTPYPVPVAVGTSLEIVHANFSNGPGQIRIAWSATPTSVNTQLLTFDLRQSGTGPSALDGWVIPNLGGYVYLTAAATGGGSPLLDCTIFTGMPPIARSPIVPNEVLFYSNPPAGASTINLPPYVGPAAIMMLPNNVAGYGIQIVCTDYLGVTQAVVRQEQGWPAGTGPFSSEGIVYLPALINQVQVSGAPGGATISGVALGP